MPQLVIYGHCLQLSERIKRHLKTWKNDVLDSLNKDKPMINAKHTPGPWKFDHDEEAAASYITAGDMPQIAMCSYTIMGGPEITEQRANAALIAAAPELLEACQAVINMPSEFNCPVAVVEMISKAIAKAEGSFGRS